MARFDPIRDVETSIRSTAGPTPPPPPGPSSRHASTSPSTRPLSPSAPSPYPSSAERSTQEAGRPARADDRPTLPPISALPPPSALGKRTFASTHSPHRPPSRTPNDSPSGPDDPRFALRRASAAAVVSSAGASQTLQAPTDVNNDYRRHSVPSHVSQVQHRPYDPHPPPHPHSSYYTYGPPSHLSSHPPSRPRPLVSGSATPTGGVVPAGPSDAAFSPPSTYSRPQSSSLHHHQHHHPTSNARRRSHDREASPSRPSAEWHHQQRPPSQLPPHHYPPPPPTDPSGRRMSHVVPGGIPLAHPHPHHHPQLHPPPPQAHGHHSMPPPPGFDPRHQHVLPNGQVIQAGAPHMRMMGHPTGILSAVSGMPSASMVPPTEGMITKRHRISRACDSCRKKKVKCDAPALIHREQDGEDRTGLGDDGDGLEEPHSGGPCGNCRKSGVPCVFSRMPMKRGPNRGYIQALEERINNLETSISTDAPAPSTSPRPYKKPRTDDDDEEMLPADGQPSELARSLSVFPEDRERDGRFANPSSSSRLGPSPTSTHRPPPPPMPVASNPASPVSNRPLDLERTESSIGPSPTQAHSATDPHHARAYPPPPPFQQRGSFNSQRDGDMGPPYAPSPSAQYAFPGPPSKSPSINSVMPGSRRSSTAHVPGPDRYDRSWREPGDHSPHRDRILSPASSVAFDRRRSSDISTAPSLLRSSFGDASSVSSYMASTLHVDEREGGSKRGSIAGFWPGRGDHYPPPSYAHLGYTSASPRHSLAALSEEGGPDASSRRMSLRQGERPPHGAGSYFAPSLDGHAWSAKYAPSSITPGGAPTESFASLSSLNLSEPTIRDQLFRSCFQIAFACMPASYRTDGLPTGPLLEAASSLVEPLPDSDPSPWTDAFAAAVGKAALGFQNYGMKVDETKFAQEEFDACILAYMDGWRRGTAKRCLLLMSAGKLGEIKANPERERREAVLNIIDVLHAASFANSRVLSRQLTIYELDRTCAALDDSSNTQADARNLNVEVIRVAITIAHILRLAEREDWDIQDHEVNAIIDYGRTTEWAKRSAEAASPATESGRRVVDDIPLLFFRLQRVPLCRDATLASVEAIIPLVQRSVSPEVTAYLRNHGLGPLARGLATLATVWCLWCLGHLAPPSHIASPTHGQPSDSAGAEAVSRRERINDDRRILEATLDRLAQSVHVASPAEVRDGRVKNHAGRENVDMVLDNNDEVASNATPRPPPSSVKSMEFASPMTRSRDRRTALGPLLGRIVCFAQTQHAKLRDAGVIQTDHTGHSEDKSSGPLCADAKAHWARPETCEAEADFARAEVKRLGILGAIFAGR